MKYSSLDLETRLEIADLEYEWGSREAARAMLADITGERWDPREEYDEYSEDRADDREEW